MHVIYLDNGFSKNFTRRRSSGLKPVLKRLEKPLREKCFCILSICTKVLTKGSYTFEAQNFSSSIFENIRKLRLYKDYLIFAGTKFCQNFFCWNLLLFHISITLQEVIFANFANLRFFSGGYAEIEEPNILSHF